MAAAPVSLGTIAVRVTLRRSSDGEERTFEEETPADDPTFLWSDGNYGCDCNRALLFARAAGEEDPEDLPCGDGGYAVRIVRATDGLPLYADGALA